jgi:WD40 repeat protein
MRLTTEAASGLSTLDFTPEMGRLTTIFTGREWVFEKIDRWLADHAGPCFFIITGWPGTGKSAIAARLTQVRDVAACHFCVANDSKTTDPALFARSLSHQLCRIDGFAVGILKDSNISLKSTQNILTNNGQAINTQINKLVVNAPSGSVAFIHVVTQPLVTLCADGYDRQVVLLVDALDEAILPGDTESIIDLLAHAGRLPQQVRFVLTSRPDDRVTDVLGEPAVDLSAPTAWADVLTYAEARLRAQDDPARMDFARRVAEASQGNFLYARYKLNEAIPRLDKGEAPSAIELPAGLDGIYREFLERELAAKLDRWEKRYRPVLGLLTVAQGDGLTREQIALISHQKQSQTDGILRRCRQYLTKPDAKGRLRIYHQSFRDFLRDDAIYNVYPREANATIADWYWKSCLNRATKRHDWNCCDEYGLGNLPVHLAEASRTDDLRRLLLNYGWLQSKLDRLGINALLSDFGLGQAADDDATWRLGRALQQAAYVLTQDPSQLAAQLLGRLLDDDDDRIRNLLQTEVRQQARRPCLLPQTASLRQSRYMLRVLAGHIDGVKGVAITRDRRIVSWSVDGTVKLWDLEKGQVLHSFLTDATGMNGATLTPDGQLLVAAYGDKTLKVWNLANDQRVHTLEGHTEAVNAAVVTPDGRCIISASNDGTVRVWDMASAQLLRTLKGHAASVNALALTPDGQSVISASNDKTLKVWDFAGGREQRTLTGHTASVTAVAVTPDGGQAVSVSEDMTMRVWDLLNDRELLACGDRKSRLYAVAVTSDGVLALSGAGAISGGWNTVKVWDIKTGELRHTFRGHTQQVNAIAVSPDRQFAISASWDTYLRVWDLASIDQRPDTPLPEDFWVNGSTAMPDGQHFISASRQTLKVWGTESSTELHTLAKLPDQPEIFLRSVAFTPDGRFVITGSSDGKLRIWDVESGGEPRTVRAHSARVNAVAATSAGQVISTSEDKTLRIWDLASGAKLGVLDGHEGEVYSVAVTSDGRCAVSGSKDGTLKLWDLATNTVVRTFKGHDDSVRAVAVTSDGRAVSASSDGTLKVWDLASGANLSTLRGHTDRVLAVAVTDDNRRVISASSDSTLKVWELESGNCLTTFRADDALRACAVLPNLPLIATGGKSGRVHILRLEENTST